MKQDIEARLTELRETLRQARSMPMSASVVVNKGEMLEMLDELEAAIDDTLIQATTVVGDREQLVASGQAEADEILRVARVEQERLASDTQVYKLAQERAAEITARAERDAAETKAELDEYTESFLANFELTLEKTLQTVQRGRARLSGGHSSGLADDSDVAGMSLPDHLHRDQG